MLTDRDKKTRASGIGASECAIAAGLSPYQTPFDLWNTKVFGLEATENNAMRAGSFLEDGVAKMAAVELGADFKLRKAGTRRHPLRRWQLATIDRHVVDAKTKVRTNRILEIKLPGSRYFYNRETGERELQWGFGPDEIPPYVACQAQWQMDVVGVDRCDVAAFFLDSRELQIYPQERNQQMIDSLVQINERFWIDHVVAQVPPPIDGSLGAKSYLAQRYPKNNNVIVPAPPDADELARLYAVASRDLKNAEKQKDRAGNQLRDLIGENDGILGPWGKATWKLDARGKVDYQKLAAALRTRVELLAQQAQLPELAADLDALVEQHREPPPRKLHVSYKFALEVEPEVAPQLTVLDGGAA